MSRVISMHSVNVQIICLLIVAFGVARSADLDSLLVTYMIAKIAAYLLISMEESSRFTVE